MTINDNELYRMKLHESIKISTRIYVLRVPGGWIYTLLNEDDLYNHVFVPFNNEFIE